MSLAIVLQYLHYYLTLIFDIELGLLLIIIDIKL